MAALGAVLAIVVAIGATFLAFGSDRIIGYLFPLSDRKQLFPYGDKTWTRRKSPEKLDSSIRPFKIAVSDAELDDLKQRLNNTRYGPPIEDAKFEYGFPPEQLRKIVKYWKDDYNWRTQEEILNAYPNYKTTIEGLQLHFVRVQHAISEKDDRIFPIILLHGWPGTFFELYKLVPLLTKPRDVNGVSTSMEVIIPSLPGFGFSEAAEVQGLSSTDMARMFHKLMERLGHPKYYVHGGDWGSMIGRTMAVMYPEHVLGLELTLYPIPFTPLFIKSAIAVVAPSLVMDPSEGHKLIWKHLGFLLFGTGPLHFQATRPDTVGAALLDSPAGLAVYILDIFAGGTDKNNLQKPNGGLEEYYTKDELLTNVMIYWVTNSMLTSQRLYKEAYGSSRADNANMLRFPVSVPTVLSDFPKEMPGGNPPTDFVKPYFPKLLKVCTHQKGGHFAGLERPEDLADDIWQLITLSSNTIDA